MRKTLRFILLADESDPSARHLSTDVFLHLDAGRRPLAARVEKTGRWIRGIRRGHQAQDCAAKDRSGIPGERGDDATRRNSACFGFEPR